MSEPLYPRLLRLRHVHPSAWQRAVLFEGMITIGALAALTDRFSAWTPVLLPLLVALLVKAHDLLLGALDTRAGTAEDDADALGRMPRAVRTELDRLLDALLPHAATELAARGELSEMVAWTDGGGVTVRPRAKVPTLSNGVRATAEVRDRHLVWPPMRAGAVLEVRLRHVDADPVTVCVPYGARPDGAVGFGHPFLGDS